jgi:hypothetical protein
MKKKLCNVLYEIQIQFNRYLFSIINLQISKESKSLILKIIFFLRLKLFLLASMFTINYYDTKVCFFNTKDYVINLSL